MNPHKTMSSPRPQTARFAGLDGLRAIAVTLVVVYHLFPASPVRSGFIGVDVFFVVSGFLITSLLLAPSPIGALGSRARLVDFWKRRARRLLPALALVVTVSATAAWIIGGDILVGLGRQVLGAATFSYNWWGIAANADYFAATTPELLRNLWSLAVEEQFYVLWPLLLPLLALLPRLWMRLTLTLIAAAASAGWMAALATQGDITRGYYGLDSHAFGILLGVALAFIWQALREREWMLRASARPHTQRIAAGGGTVGVALVVGAALLPSVNSALTFPGTLLLASVGTILVIGAALWPSSRLGAVIDVAPLRWLGDRSYGIYLWHWPIFVLVVAASPAISSVASPAGAGAGAGATVWAGVGALALTLVVADVSYRFIEMPIRRRGLRASLRSFARAFSGSSSRRFAAASIAVASAVVIGGTVASVVTAPTQSSAEAHIKAGEAALAEAPTPVATPAPMPTDGLEGLEGAASALPTPAPSMPPGDQLTAVGDSVMLASARALLNRFPGIAVDAEVSRSVWTGAEIIAELNNAGQLRPTVVVALGTNGPVDIEALTRIAHSAGTNRDIILVNAYAPRDWIPGVNAELTAFADARDGVVIADWSRAISTRLDLLAEDQVHPDEEGGEVFADAIVDALTEVADERREAKIRHKAAASLIREVQAALRLFE